MLTLMLPNDHGTRERAKAGFPFTQSYMADNDLALGRVVEFLSKTPYWKKMLIVVLEDDPQGGVDHIDAHRSLLLTISPWVKKNYVGHEHYSFGSVFKTFWNILGMPYLNQYDAGATNLIDLFTDKPDFTPYNAVAIDKRLFDPQKALDPFDEKFDWKAFSESEELDRTETPLQHMTGLMKGATPGAVRAQLGRFGFSGPKATTESLVMRSRSGTVRRVHATHDRSKLRQYAAERFG